MLNKKFTLVELLLVVSLLSIASLFITNIIESHSNIESYKQTQDAIYQLQGAIFTNKKNYYSDTNNTPNTLIDILQSTDNQYQHNSIANQFYGWDGPYLNSTRLNDKKIINPFTTSNSTDDNWDWEIEDSNNQFFIQTEGDINADLNSDFNFSSPNLLYPSNSISSELDPKFNWAIRNISFYNQTHLSHIPYRNINNKLEPRNTSSINARILIFDGTYDLEQDYDDFLADTTNNKYLFNQNFPLPLLVAGEQKSIQTNNKFGLLSDFYNDLNSQSKELRQSRISLILIDDTPPFDVPIADKILGDFEPIQIDLQNKELPNELNFYTSPPIKNFPNGIIFNNAIDITTNPLQLRISIQFNNYLKRLITLGETPKVTVSLALANQLPTTAIEILTIIPPEDFEFNINKSDLISGESYIIYIESNYGTITLGNSIRLLFVAP